MLQQNSEYRSNDPVVNAVHSHAECGNNNRILLRPPTRKSNARLGEPQFGQILHCTEQNFSQGWKDGWAVLEMTGTLPKRNFTPPGCCFTGMRMLRL